MKHILGSFSSAVGADNAIDSLKELGYERTDMSVFSSKDSVLTDGVKYENNVLEEVKDTAGKGAIVGGALGLLVGLGALTIPGLGLLFIAGPITAALGLTGVAGTTAAGALTGTLVGGLAGALKEAGMDEETAQQLEEDLRKGDIIVGVSVDEADVSTIEAIYRTNDADHISSLELGAEEM